MPIFGIEITGEWAQWTVAGGILAFFLLLALISRFVLKSILHVVARNTKTKLDDMIIAKLVGPFFAGLIAAGIWLALIRIPELSGYSKIIHQLGGIYLWALATVVASRVVNVFLVWYKLEIAPRTKNEADDKIIPLLQRISKVIIYSVGLLIILRNQLDIDISPILAGLGIGGLAVALALQSTLTNFLAGTYVMSDAVIHSGDYIQLDSGQEGFVEDIGWRTTKLRNWQGNLIILPNSKMSESIITDYEKPNRAMLFLVECGVNYDSDLSKVEKVALAAAEEVLRNSPAGDKDFTPILRFKKFGDSNIDFEIILKSIDRPAHFLLKSELIKILHKRFAEQGIDIQYPVRKIIIANAPAVNKPHAQDILNAVQKDT